MNKLSSKDFSHLRNKDSKTFKTKHLLFFYQQDQKDSDDLEVSYGLTVTKKKIKTAVGRNRVKRILRECVRNSSNCKSVDKSLKVNIVYAPKSDLSSLLCSNVIHQEVEQFFSKFS